jgi:DNA-binding MarR family transcriptional regulator
MADINFKTSVPGWATDGSKLTGVDEAAWDVIELLFFAYRDFVGDADDVLAKFSFGRAHHRVMHFVYRYPGLTVADLLDVLRITKQSLGRVLKQLIDENYIVQRAGENDKRQRLLFATPKGEAIVTRLAALQTRRIEKALSGIEPEKCDIIRQFLREMIDRNDPDKVLQIVLGNNATTKERK